MADVKISALPAATVPLAGTEVLPIVQSSTTRQVSVANLTAGRAISASSITNSALTSGRVTYAGASGLLSDSANLVFNGTNLGIGTGVTPNKDITIYKASTDAEIRLQAGTNDLYLSARNSGGQFDIVNASNAGITFGTNNLERMRITSAGLVGIGTSSPAAPLDIGGNPTYQNQMIWSRGVSDTDFKAVLTSGDTGSSASIGSIGARYAGYKDFASIQFYRNSTVGNLLFFTGGLSADGTEKMRITSTGNVGIGTTSPAAAVGISVSPMTSQLILGQNASASTYGAISFNGVNTDAGRLGFTGGGGDTALYVDVPGGILTFRNAGVTNMTVNSSGIVTMSAYGAGAATFSAAGVISSVSDETWKTKDGVPTNTDAMLQKLEPGYWFYNEEKAPIFGQDRQLGFYAQNVHEAIGSEAAPTPETYKDADGNDVSKPWGYYDRSVLAVTVMSLKNALNTIEELKQRITALENK